MMWEWSSDGKKSGFEGRGQVNANVGFDLEY